MRRDKRLERLRRSATDVKPAELRTVLEAAGFLLDRTKGSHEIYVHPDRNDPVVVPFRKLVKRIYVREVLKAIEEVQE